MKEKKGGFTLPGESGYEALTLELAQRWGADVIRDSDGTDLSEEILNAGYGIYSTICIIREHNEWAKQNPGHLQQSFLMTPPKVATDHRIKIELLSAFYDEQFQVNESEESLNYWQVFDRTTGTEIPKNHWRYVDGNVLLEGVIPFHSYTVNFLAWRVWEEISMYNHVTNNWGNKEHLVPLDPRYPAVRQYLLDWLEQWCVAHPRTTVVRFTSLFYNFVWIWGSDAANRNLFTDWASYDFTVSPLALREFEQAYGYVITSEDFINAGKLQATHLPPTRAKKDWMDFISGFVLDFGRQLVDIVHKHGKKAYVFYDDSWVGLEPYGPNFAQYRFDGLIKCVFSGFEARLCAEAEGIKTRELRLHPYLFPTGLGGAPTFAPGGNPTRDAQVYWTRIRRALLRKPVDRIGLGGYLHLTQQYPDFVEYIETLAEEFRTIHELHETGRPAVLPVRVAVLHRWGKLRSWTLSGHFHETDTHPLIHIIEALSGLPVEVEFLSFEDVLAGGLEKIDAVINAGFAGSAWSGGGAWANPEVVSAITQWVYEGGFFLGVDEPSATPGFDTVFRMAPVLGVDMDTGARVCHGRWPVEISPSPYDTTPRHLKPKKGLYLTDGNAEVLAAEAGLPQFVRNRFGSGVGVYLSSFQVCAHNNRLLMEILSCDRQGDFLTDNPYTEAAAFGNRLAVVNNSAKPQCARIALYGQKEIKLAPYEMKVLTL